MNEPSYVLSIFHGFGRWKSITGGFWAVIDFAFYQGDLFVLETNPGGFVPFDGQLCLQSDCG
jgi:hypothetical protein